jgi:hypothetical protein
VKRIEIKVPLLSQGTNQARRGSRKRPTAAASDGSANFDDANTLSGGAFSALPTQLSFSFLPSRLLAST